MSLSSLPTMSEIDVNQQWRDLQESYSAMSDEELQTIANDSYDLTDVAKQALQAEASRRRLNLTIQKAPPTTTEEPPPPSEPETETDTDIDTSQLTDLSRVWSLSEARKLKETLDWAGVPVFFGPERVENLARLRGGFEHGVDVRVRDFDQQRAMAALAHAAIRDVPENSEADENVDVPYTPHCPKCHSTEVVFQGLDLNPLTKSAFDSKFNWSCEACGHQWKDDGIEAET